MDFVPVYLFILMLYYYFAKERSFLDEKNICFVWYFIFGVWCG